ncbi:MAG: hypothetical protein V7L20_00970 [Nostoc sp.]|uniref:hypothetical protein n=1 Tax=Nostoc sp. TaxID=1180 RepID=UPI002FF81466
MRFFNSRRDFWGEHFRLDEAVIVHQTDFCEVTAPILYFNGDERLVERQALITSGQYPSASALKQLFLTKLYFEGKTLEKSIDGC